VVRALAATEPSPTVLDGPPSTGLPTTGIVLVATGHEGAPAAAEAAARVTGGTVPVVLAPWLLDADVVAQLADQGRSVLFAVLRDPTSPRGVDYRVALGKATGGGLRASAAGLEAYLDALATLAGDLVPVPAGGVFGLSRVAVLPPSVEGHESEAGWARGVALVKVG
jgi:hypothetical protein